MPSVPLTYMSGAGNLFTVIDDRTGVMLHESVTALCPLLVQAGADRPWTTEGVLVVRHADARGRLVVDFHNPDGSSSMMCGNGGRCAVRFAVDSGLIPKSVNRGVLHMAGTAYAYEVDGDDISLTFGAPTTVRIDIGFACSDAMVRGAYVDVGSDHLVIEQSAWEKAFGEWSLQRFLEVAPSLRSHPTLPRGANVNVYRSIAPGVLRLTTFERGVETVTNACGTGALATSVVAWMTSGQTTSSWQCIPPSGEVLRCEVRSDHATTISALVLTGPARILAHGTFTLPEDAS